MVLKGANAGVWRHVQPALDRLPCFPVIPVVGCFPQSYHLERPDSDAKISFFYRIMGQGLEGPEGTEIGDESICRSEGEGARKQGKG